MSFAVLFPGQGSQFVGMGVELFEARPDLLGQEADDLLGFSLREVCLEGPPEALTLTEHAQPALFAVAYALWDLLQNEIPPPAAAAGHSLGEYTALAAAGAIDYWDALAVVAERGRAMAAAAGAEPSGMAALIGAERPEAEQVCAGRRADGGRLWVANVNSPGQVVVAGAAADLTWLTENGRELGIRRVIPLQVAGAFHTPLMAPASERVAAALAGAHTSAPAFSVYGNVDAAPLTEANLVPSLVSQVESPVLFAATLERMADDGVDTFLHVGPGDVTAGLVRRTLPGAEVAVVSTAADIAEAAASLVSIR